MLYRFEKAIFSIPFLVFYFSFLLLLSILQWLIQLAYSMDGQWFGDQQNLKRKNLLFNDRGFL